MAITSTSGEDLTHVQENNHDENQSVTSFPECIDSNYSINSIPMPYPDFEPEAISCEEPSSDSFLNLSINIRNTLAYKKARCLSVITDVFVKKYISKFSRTTDQMIQASRSVKQNLVEGAFDGATSKETEIKLFNVARGSLHELLDDYLDFLDYNHLKKWEWTDSRLARTRVQLIKEMDPVWYARLPGQCSVETCANIIITLIHQTDTLIKGLIEKCERDFIANGGLRETMTKHRLAARNNRRNK